MAGGGGGTQVQTNIPPFLEAPTRKVVGAGEELVFGEGSGYTPYDPYQAVAPLSQSQMMGVGETQNLGQQARFTPEVAEYYMNPYQRAVTDIAKREATKDATRLASDLGSRAARAGAFGGSRFGLQESQLRDSTAQRLADIETKGSEAAYRDAQKMFGADRAETYNRIGALGKAGGLERGIQQDLRDFAYGQFQDAQDYDFDRLERLRSLISGVPYSSVQQTQRSSPSAAAQIAGLGLAAYGASPYFPRG